VSGICTIWPTGSLIQRFRWFIIRIVSACTCMPHREGSSNLCHSITSTSFTTLGRQLYGGNKLILGLYEGGHQRNPSRNIHEVPTNKNRVTPYCVEPRLKHGSHPIFVLNWTRNLSENYHKTVLKSGSGF